MGNYPNLRRLKSKLLDGIDETRLLSLNFPHKFFHNTTISVFRRICEMPKYVQEEPLEHKCKVVSHL